MMEAEKNWYALYTKPRWEKKIAAKLQDKGLHAYCPLNKVTRQWSDRRKVVEEPLFKGYVFVQVSEEEKWRVKEVNGVLNYVYWNGKVARIREEEIETIRKFLNEFHDVEVHEARLEVNKKVRVRQGILMNHEGILLEVTGNRARVQIESMGVVLSAIFERKNLEPVI